ncbi:SGNH/GDSL hydrolase family protein [Amycolatopsis ultiminotia]|uniref:SGNH/GDSL hydrolase family protein n=1 Tax=Amycolatopsis ultiminotia TaxID=543629 RepID=A0ABP6Y5X7_9PSEU
MRRSAFVVVGVIAAVLFGAVPAGASGQPSFRKYVALGDSYTAGPLIPWQQASWCFRSNNNYPSWLAARLGIASGKGAFTDVSCSSADTTNMTRPQVTPSPDIPLSSQPAQFDALTLDTDLVTIGIGGNDYGVFGDLIGTCPTVRDSDPTGDPCRRHFTVDGVDTMAAAVEHTGENVRAVVRGARERSPGATIVLVGYPRLVPSTGYCPDVLPLADGDYRWADHVEQQLNAAIAGAANAEGARFVDTYGPSLGHDACAGDAAWVNGQSTNLFAAVAYHPYRAGMAAEAALIAQSLGVHSDTGAPPAHDPASADQLDRMARTAGLTR